MKTLTALLNELKYNRLYGSTDHVITGISSDSRTVEPGYLFVALEGVHTDGHQFIQQAFNKGAVGAVINEKNAHLIQQYPEYSFLIVPDTSIALGYLASSFYDHPSQKLTLVGVTGTNGKTTIATLLYHLYRTMGYGVGLLSTVAYYIHNERYEASHTTPDPITINAFLEKMVRKQCQYCFMEVSSHACDQNRIAGLRFSGGIFTNLTHDHLDYHQTFEHYRDAKKTFFDTLPPSAFALTNVDDKNGMYMLQNTKARKRTYSLSRKADYRAVVLENTIRGLVMKFEKFEVHFRLCGYFNAYNILAVYGAALELGLLQEEVLQVLSSLSGAEGRFQLVENQKQVHAIVDYAHTPDALQNVMDTINQIRSGFEKFIVVVGAGGDRDKTKRPLMAKIAATYADLAIFTSDNPRTEDPRAILNDMMKGIDEELLKKTLVIEDRRSAIQTASMMSKPGDILLIAGKGHEKYQEINGVRYPFDDVETVKEFLNI